MIDLRRPVNLPPPGPSYAVRGDSRFPTWLYHAVHGSKEFKNEAAFNAAIADGWVDSPAKLSTTERTGGPTIEVYVAAGYPAKSYPPSGYAEVPSPGLTEYRLSGTIGGVSQESPEMVAQTNPVVETSPAAETVLPDATAETVSSATTTDVVARAFTPEELKSVHKESAGDLIDAVERAKDPAFVQFVLDVETVNPVKPRPSVMQAAQTRLAKLTAKE